jgi:hypothetical protein
MTKVLTLFLIISCYLAILVNCRKRSAVCEPASETGPCRALFYRFYFNTSTNQCEQFIYGGCGGKQNNDYKYKKII